LATPNAPIRERFIAMELKIEKGMLHSVLEEIERIQGLRDCTNEVILPPSKNDGTLMYSVIIVGAVVSTAFAYYFSVRKVKGNKKLV
jgi:hypothetical protein